MLKALVPGAQTSGFVKMETRMGHCEVTVSAQGFRANQRIPLKAVLTMRDARATVEIGELLIDHHGQGSVRRVFDDVPVAGVRLSRYEGVCVLQVQDDEATPLLGGSIGGEGYVDWRAVALRAAGLASEPSATVVPEKTETATPPPEQPIEENKKEAPTQLSPELALAPTLAPTEMLPIVPAEPLPDAAETPVLHPEQPPTSWRWPERCGDIEALFMASPPCNPFGEQTNAAYVRVAMPGVVTGADHYVMGVDIEDGEVKRIRYGVPGNKRATPPPGLEGYRWRQDKDGGGYWLAGYDAATGEVVA